MASNFYDMTGEELEQGYAKGGQVKMEDQMKLFQEGGLADDGMTKEPVTGNEIPPGSMASEVRDDVDVKLSEGEYVVPADVVRYYGVKFFEGLRSEAKSDMMDMEQQGRIGGTPVNDNGVPTEEPLTAEEEQMLKEVMTSQPVGMAEGGQVKSVPQNPYSFGTAYSAPTQMPYGQPSGAYGGSGAGQMEARQYINTQTGQVRSFQFLNGRSLSLIPKGFVPMTAEAKAQAEQAQASQTATQGSGESTGQISEGGQAEAMAQFGAKSANDSFEDSVVESPSASGIGKGAAMGLGALAGFAVAGIPGAISGAKEGKDVANYSAARGAMIDAIMSNDVEAQKAAEDDVISSFSELSFSGKLAAGILGAKSGKDAVKSITSEVEAFQGAMADAAPPGMEYDPTTQSYSRVGSPAPSSSSRPSARPGSVSTPTSTNSEAVGAEGSSGGSSEGSSSGDNGEWGGYNR